MMQRYFSEGGARNPHFPYKVKVKYPIDGTVEWCNNYPTQTEHGYFERYYIEFAEGDSNYVTFQFEWEEPAIMFALKFGSA